MSDLYEMMSRLHRATQHDEVPLVKALNDVFDESERTEGGAEVNRRKGDCWFRHEGKIYSVESQIASPGKTRFSYTLEKCEKFVGHEGKIENCFVVLGCSRSKDKPDERVFAVIRAADLNKIITEGGEAVAKKEETYVVLNPMGIAANQKCVLVAPSFESMAKDLKTFLDKKKKR